MDPKEQNQPAEVETNTATPPEPEMVDIHEATKADLEAELARSLAAEWGSGNAASEEPETQSQQPNEQTPAPEGAEGVAAQGAEPSKPAKVYTQEEVQGILAENERQKNLGNQKELFIQHRGTELGQLRAAHAAKTKELETLKAQLEAGLQDRFVENAPQAIKDSKEIERIDNEIAAIQQTEERAQRIVEAQTFFFRNVDHNKITPKEIADMLIEDGMDPAYLQNFEKNPWEFTTGEALVQMGKRAIERKEAKQADNDRRVLAAHVIKLNAEIKALKARPGQVVSQLQRSLNQSPSITAASSASARGGRSLDPSTLTNMSNAEVKEALRQAQQSEGMH